MVCSELKRRTFASQMRTQENLEQEATEETGETLGRQSCAGLRLRAIQVVTKIANSRKTSRDFSCLFVARLKLKAFANSTKLRSLRFLLFNESGHDSLTAAEYIVRRPAPANGSRRPLFHLFGAAELFLFGRHHATVLAAKVARLGLANRFASLAGHAYFLSHHDVATSTRTHYIIFAQAINRE
jgi:hypothetical protein